VAEQHRFGARAEFSNVRVSRVIEHELDMERSAGPPRAPGARLRRLIGWLMPERRSAGNPARSIARELEEAFPSRDN
jgi:hypothetical protein